MKKNERYLVPPLTGDFVDDTQRRYIEGEKYKAAYAMESYKMGGPRMEQTSAALQRVKRAGGAFLDMSTGRGEMLDVARALGFAPVWGTESILDLTDPAKNIVLGFAHYLPFKDDFFNVSMMIDVIEHLIPGDDKAACDELARVTRRFVFISANNRKSHAGPDGVELHINRRPYDEWHDLFKSWFGKAAKVHRFKPWPKCTSILWRIDL